MDATHCNVIYVDNTIREDRVFKARSRSDDTPIPQSQHSRNQRQWESKTLEENVSLLSDVFGAVHLCSSGGACMAKLFNMQDELIMDLKPTVVLISTPHDERIPIHEQSRPPSPHSVPPRELESAPNTPPAGDAYGLRLLQRIVSEAHLRNLSKLIVPVSVITFPESEPATDAVQASKFKTNRAFNRPLMKGCLKLGATDVFFSPIQPQSITSLEIRAYWAHKSVARDQQAVLELQRGRKRSWVGIADNRPYAYLRENMVASLMRKICQMEEGDELPVDAVRISVSSQRKRIVAEAVGSWHFSAHDFNDDELVEASALMFKHALSMPELKEWRIPADQLTSFLVACRSAYNSFVPYHNFRHVVDVLQATFNFLVNIGALPPFPPSPNSTSAASQKAKSPMASLVRPFEALTLLITAIGHDVGHPGVNNGFLIVLNTPLAQLYNDRSVLESFHCAAYSQILRRYWPAAFNDMKMRKLMISSILATDMGLHFDYMNKLGSIQDKLAVDNNTDGWNGRMFEDQTALACALLIKCADISNVARHQGAAVQWMHILSDEFSRQAYMENQLSIKSSLVSQPRKDKISLYQSQLGFMNLFAIPLFQCVANIMPAMQYCVDELEINKVFFMNGIEQAKAAEAAENLLLPVPTKQHTADGALSPRSLSVVVPNDAATNVTKAELSQTKHTTITIQSEHTNGISPRPIPSNIRVPTEKDAVTSHFNAVAEFAASDPFNVNCASRDGERTQQEEDDDDDASRRFASSSKQRVSEATEATAATEVTDTGSTSIPSAGGGDWASQATSATTGKMPLSPSTQGTSIVSRDSASYDQPYSGAIDSIDAIDGSSAAPALNHPAMPRPPRTPLSHTSAADANYGGHLYTGGNSNLLSTQRSREMDGSSMSSSAGGHSQYMGNGSARKYMDERLASSPSNPYLNPSTSPNLSPNQSPSPSPNHNSQSQQQPILKKKSSRFRMNAFTFFRRHLSPTPPIPTSNPTDHTTNHSTSS